MKLLLDTTVLIDVLRGNKERIARLKSMPQYELATSAVNVAELYAGKRASEEPAIVRLIAELEVWSVTGEIGESAGDLVFRAARKGKTIALPDALIAATALAHDCPVMSANRKDFASTGVVMIEDPQNI